MPKPRINVNSVAVHDDDIEQGTLLEHNDPPTMLVLVTEYFGETADHFSGVCLEDGVYYENGWNKEEFHIFRGDVTLSQE